MSERLIELRRKYFNLMNSIPFVEADLDYSVLENHIPHLENMDKLGNFAVSVFDLYQKKHVYVSPTYINLRGQHNESHLVSDGFDQLMHPDDLLMSYEAGYYFLKNGLITESSQKKKMKLFNEFRIRKSDGSWMRMTEQHQLLELDIHDNIWLGLSIVDVSSDQDVSTPMRSRLVNQETGELYTFPMDEVPMISFVQLSKREQEILNLLAEGNISKQIAGKLYISIHTVNTHRQNIIGKMGVGNTAEAVRLASKIGIL
jgi:DNA-binding CsgD family transcriptional regulator